MSAAEVSSRVLSVIYQFYLARALSVEGFGVFGSSRNITLFFMLFASLGLDAIGTREIAKNSGRINKIVNNILTIRIIFGIVVYLLLAIFVSVVDKPLSEKIVIMIFGINILATNTLLNWVFQGVERLTVYAVRTIIANVLNFLGIILLIHSPDDLILSAGVISFTLIVNSIWMFLLYVKDYGKFHFEFDFPLWKEFILQGIPIGLTFFIIGVYNYQGVVLLNFFATPYYAGLYNAAFNVIYVATLLSTIIQQVYYPIFSKHSDSNQKLHVFQNYSKITFSVGTFVPLFLFVFADKVIYFFGKDYSDSMFTIRILMIATLFIYISISYFSPLIAWKHEKKVVYANLSGLIVNLIANYFLIPKLYQNGTAIAALISEFTVFAIMAIIFYPVFKNLFLIKYLKYLILALISTLPFLYIRLEGLENLILMASSFISFVILSFLFKTIQVSEIKKILKKE